MLAVYQRKVPRIILKTESEKKEEKCQLISKTTVSPCNVKAFHLH